MAYHTVYRRPNTAGGAFRQVVGLSLPAPGGGGAFDVLQSDLALVPLAPEPGDRLRDDSGHWWTVTDVGAPEDGTYVLTCESDPGEDEGGDGP